MANSQGQDVQRIYGTLSYTDTATPVEIGTLPAYAMAIGIHVGSLTTQFAGGSGDWTITVQLQATGDVGGLWLTIAEFATTDYTTLDGSGIAGVLGIARTVPIAFRALFTQGGTPETSGSAVIAVTYILFDTP